jgi:hypothetical protein
MCKRYTFFPSSPFLSLLMARRPSNKTKGTPSVSEARAGAADSLKRSRPHSRARDDVPCGPKARPPTSSRTKTKVGFWVLHTFFDAYREKKKVTIQLDPSDEEFSLEGISEDEDGDDDDDEVSDTSGPPPNRLPVGTPALNPPQPVGSNVAHDIIHFFTETVSIGPTNIEKKFKTCKLCM